MASPERDKEGFTLVDRKRQKKRKAEHSPLLHISPGSSSTSPPGTPTRPKSSNFDYPNTVPVIFRDDDQKFKTVKQVMSELSQYHLELRVSRVKDLSNKVFFTRRPNFAKQKQIEGLPRPKFKDQSTQSLPS